LVFGAASAETFATKYMHAGFVLEIWPASLTVKDIPWHYVSLVNGEAKAMTTHDPEDSADYFVEEFLSYEPDKTHGGLFCVQFSGPGSNRIISGMDWSPNTTDLREVTLSSIKSGAVPFSMCAVKDFEGGRHVVSSKLIVGFPGWLIKDRMVDLNRALQECFGKCLEAV
jgi:hypothetical protein